MGHTVIIMVKIRIPNCLANSRTLPPQVHLARTLLARGKSSSSEMAHRAIVGKICPDANFEGVDGAPGCTLRSLGDGKRTIVLEWYGHH